MFTNSLLKSTLEDSSAPLVNVPKPPLPAVPSVGLPEDCVSFHTLSPSEDSPSGLEVNHDDLAEQLGLLVGISPYHRTITVDLEASKFTGGVASLVLCNNAVSTGILLFTARNIQCETCAGAPLTTPIGIVNVKSVVLVAFVPFVTFSGHRYYQNHRTTFSGSSRIGRVCWVGHFGATVPGVDVPSIPIGRIFSTFNIKTLISWRLPKLSKVVMLLTKL